MSDKEYKKPITVNEEELDLGKLFSMIGKMFKSLFNFLEKSIKMIFHYLILLLIFIKGHLLKIIIAIILGSLVGFLLDYSSPQEYTYDMLIEPNYKSIDEVYEKMEYYNVLIESNDTVSLVKEFNISNHIAKKLSKFEIIPYESEKDQLLAYDAFIKKTDTLTHKQFSYKDFKGKGTSKFDSRYYVYRIITHTSTLPSLETSIISAVEKNLTLQKRRRIKMSTIKLDSIATRDAMKDLSLLRKRYEKMALLEVEKNEKSSSTYIDFSKENKSDNDIELFKIAKSLNEDLLKVEISKESTENIINVISTFNPSGKKTGTFYETKMFLFGRFFGMLKIAFILLIGLNKYLVNYRLKS